MTPTTAPTLARGRGNVAFAIGNALPLREAGNVGIIPISPDLIKCATCRNWFYRVQDSQRYCCSQHRVTGSKRRRKRTIEAFVIIATTMSGGRITEAMALDCIEWNMERCEGVVRAWGYEFDTFDKLVRV